MHNVFSLFAKFFYVKSLLDIFFTFLIYLRDYLCKTKNEGEPMAMTTASRYLSKNFYLRRKKIFYAKVESFDDWTRT